MKVNFDSTIEIEAGPASAEGAVRVPTFDAVAYSGAPMHPQGWTKKEPLVLSISGMEIESDSLPINADHEQGLFMQVGHGSATKTPHDVQVSGAFSVPGKATETIVAGANNGRKWKTSVEATLTKLRFLKAGQRTTANGRSYEGPLYIANSRLIGLAILSRGADSNTSVQVFSKGVDEVMADETATTVVTDDTEQTPSQTTNASASEEVINDQNTATVDLEAAAETAAEAVVNAGTSTDNAAEASEKPDTETVAAESSSAGSPTEKKETTVSASATEATDVLSPEEAAEATRKAIRAAAQEETARLAMIEGHCGSEFTEIRAQAIGEEWSEEKVELAVLKATNAKQAEELEEVRAGRGTGPAIHSVSDDEFLDSNVYAAALHEQFEWPIEAVSQDSAFFGEEYGEKAMEVSARARKKKRRIGLDTICFDVIRAAGGTPADRSLTPDVWNQVIRANKKLEAGMDINAASSFSTFSLSGILSNLANKRLLELRRNWPSIVERVCARATHNDFKVHTIQLLDGDAEPHEIAATGEIPHGSLSEETYTNRVYPFARMLAIDFVSFRNDDLRALDQRVTKLIRDSFRGREKLFIRTLVDPAQVGVFYRNTGNQQNYITGVGGLSAANLAQASTLMRSQKTVLGEPIHQVPGMLLTAVEQEEDANNLLSRTTISIENTSAASPAGTARVFDQFRGRFQPLVSPFLDTGIPIPGVGGLNSYIFADPVMSDDVAFEYAVLDGWDDPTVDSSETDFNTWGFQSRVRWCYGFGRRQSAGVVRMDAA